MSQPNTVMRHMSLGRILDPLGTNSPPGNSSRGPQSPLIQGSSNLNPVGTGADGDSQRLQEEITNLRSKLHSWEESWNQAKQVRVLFYWDYIIKGGTYSCEKENK